MFRKYTTFLLQDLTKIAVKFEFVNKLDRLINSFSSRSISVLIPHIQQHFATTSGGRFLNFGLNPHIFRLARPRLHETGTNSDPYQSDDFLRCLHEIGIKLKPCSCKYFWPNSEFSLIPCYNAYLVRHINRWSGESSRFHEENFVPDLYGERSEVVPILCKRGLIHQPCKSVRL